MRRLEYALLWLRVNYPIYVRQSRWNMLHSNLLQMKKDLSL